MNRALFSIGRAILLLCAAAAFSVAVSPAAEAARDRGLEKRLKSHIETLASDDFQGRQPGTEGEAKTLRYLGREWFRMGLVSGTNDPGNAWFAPVTLVAREPASSSALFTRRTRRIGLPQSEVLLLTSGKRALVRKAPLLFVGRAELAGFSRAELAGRVAVLLDGERESSARQNALLAAGASGALTVLVGTRTLEQIAARRRRSGYALADDMLGGDLEGFITREGMERLLKYSRYSLAGLEKAAARADFSSVALGISASLEATTRETTIRTYNLIAKLPGKRPDLGAVLLVSHWDHFGVCAEVPAENLVCNGAVDNASGVAALTEIARRLTRGSRLDRDVYFLATTAEELGLLGAHAFAEDPPLPLSQIVAAFNIDTIAIAPRGTPLGIVGKGMTGLDEEIAKVAERQGRRIVPGEEANEYVRRQDGWALLQHDIPAVMVTSAYGEISRMRRFFESHYHRPSDDLTLPLELGGAAEDVKFHVALVRWFADAARFSTEGK
ncbi:MAG: M20/M25/M40 family metallo-hydrolase [Sphingomonadaceae bacterium]|nr:M20/M25/M40 family metallo-hydrolase [Sphingomonadaceae bacterium]